MHVASVNLQHTAYVTPMQGAYSLAMEPGNQRHALRRINLDLLLSDPRVGTATRLADLLGKPSLSTYFSAIKRGSRDMGDKLATDIEDAAGKPRGWMDQHHLIAGESTPSWPVAHSVSYPMRFDDVPVYAWENIINIKPLPDTFGTRLPDDAMAPEFPQGTEIVWTKLRRVAPGRLMLLSDEHGQLHVRMCVQGRAPGHWRAVPSNAAFVEFDNQGTPGLSVVAVFKGRMEPNDA